MKRHLRIVHPDEVALPEWERAFLAAQCCPWSFEGEGHTCRVEVPDA